MQNMLVKITPKPFLAALLGLFLSFSSVYAEETIIAEVHGMVCEFCAIGLEKQFNKQEAVQSIAVSLEAGTVKLVLKDGQQLNDEKITKIITDNGIHVANIERTVEPTQPEN